MTVGAAELYGVESGVGGALTDDSSRRDRGRAMMRWIVGTSLRFRFLVVALAAAMMFFGVGQLRNMPVDVFPEFAPPRVEIQTAGLGLSAAEVEELVTVPLEQALNGVAGLDIMRSKSVPAAVVDRADLQAGTDLLEARQLVAGAHRRRSPRRCRPGPARRS